ncbi:hypothetical protein [Vibrio owensii]|uniref:hypothetical protein n=1 Tax=Vibrio owensii TaxID=696485 RepID=UPI003CC6A2E7
MIKMTSNDKVNFLIYRLARAESERLRLTKTDAVESAQSVIESISIGRYAKSWKHNPFIDHKMNDLMSEFLHDYQVAQDKFVKSAKELQEANLKRLQACENEINGLTKLLYKNGVSVQNQKLYLPLINKSATFEKTTEMYKHLMDTLADDEFTVLEMNREGVYLACPDIPEAFNKLSHLVTNAAVELRSSVGGLKKVERHNPRFEFNPTENDYEYFDLYADEQHDYQVNRFIANADSKYLIQYNKMTNFGENVPSL